MKIETRFNLGDIVYRIHKEFLYEVCPLCNGEKTIEAELGQKSFKITCPECKGYGKVTTTENPIWTVKEVVYTGIGSLAPQVEAEYYVKEIIVREEGIFLKLDLTNQDKRLNRYGIERLRVTIRETEAFLSKEEAQECCDRLNGQGE